MPWLQKHLSRCVILPIHPIPQTSSPEPLLSPSLILTLVQWDIMVELDQANACQPHTSNFVKNCHACATSELPKQLPSRLLHSPPIPHWPWFYIALTSSLISRFLRATLPYSESLTDSQKLAHSFPSPNCPLHSRQLSDSFSASSAIMASLKIFSLIEVPSLQPGFG